MTFWNKLCKRFGRKPSEPVVQVDVNWTAPVGRDELRDHRNRLYQENLALQSSNDGYQKWFSQRNREAEKDTVTILNLRNIVDSRELEIYKLWDHIHRLEKRIETLNRQKAKKSKRRGNGKTRAA